MSEAVIKLKVDGASAAQRDVNSVSSALTSLGATAKSSLAGLAVGLSAATFADYIKSAIDAADNLNDLSKSTAISVENLSGLKLAAKQSGSELESVAQAINKLSVNIGKDSERFAKLGITAKEPIEAFKQLADVYNRIEDPQTRAAVAAEALGKSWQGTAPLLAEGSKSIGDMVEKGKRLSGVTQEMADEADKFNDSLEELKQKSDGLGVRIASDLLPTMNDFAGALLDVSNKTKLVSGASKDLANENALGGWADSVGLGLARLVDVINLIPRTLSAVSSSFKVVAADVNVAAAAVAIPGNLGGVGIENFKRALEERNKVLKDANKEYDELWNYDGAAAANAFQKRVDARLLNEFLSSPNAPTAPSKGSAVNTKSFLGGNNGVQKEKDDYDKLNKAIQARIATAQEELRLGRALSESEKESANFKRGLAEGTIKLTAAEAKRYEGSINQLDIELRKLETEKLYQAARDKNEGEIKRINDETLALEGQIEAYEKLPSLITQVTIAKLEEQKAELKNSGLDNVEEEISAINRKIEAYSKLQNVQVNKQYQDASKFIDDYAKSVEESNKQIQLEASLIGKSAIERDVILDQARIQAELEKKINDIKKQGLTLDQETGLIEKANQVANAERSASQLKAQQKEWNDFYSSIYDGLSDSLYRAFESGKGFFQSFWDGIKNLFKTTVLKLAIQGTVGSILGSGSGLASAATGQGVGGIASGLGSLTSGISSIFGGSSAASTASSAGGLTSIFGSSAFSSAIPVIGQAFVGYSIAKAIGGGYKFGGLSSGLSAVLGGGVIARLFGSKPKELTGSTIQGTLGTNDISTVDSYFQKGGLFKKDKRSTVTTGLANSTADNAELLKTLNDAYAQIKASSTDYAKALGLNAESIASRIDTINYAVGKTAEETQANYTKALESVSNNIADSVIGGFTELKKAGESSSAALTRLAGDLTGVNATFKELGLSIYSIDVQGAKAAESLIAAFGNLDTLVSASKTYYDNFYSDQEKLSLKTQALGQAFKDVGLIVPETRDAFRGLVEAAKAAGDQTTYANLIKLSGQFAEVVPAAIEETSNATDAFTRLLGTATDSIKDSAKEVKNQFGDIGSAVTNGLNNIEASIRSINELRATLFTGENSPLNSRDSYNYAKSQLSSATPENVQSLVSAFLEAAKKNSTSSLQYTRDVGFADATLNNVKNGLTQASEDLIRFYRALADRNAGVVDGSHSSGLDYVPFDGYVAQLHRGERVQTASQASSSDASVSELKALREEIRAGQLAMAKSLATLESLAKKADVVGVKTVPA